MAEKTSKSSQTAKVVPLKRAKCPTCGKPSAPEARPFCSKRCADIDLGRWLNEDYRVPTNEYPDDGEAMAGQEDET